ncbi:regulatory protein RecX [Gracilimonas mengyeensis]|uniref:Regulatory protein RecX n=1 Tax=Gracilimonas mengyeensis TaxID=1302730 RepID=A0A521ER67_9BACT|nr:RecX family transcriptional regulator [Gracilimonas mengyeensis]SMO86395.1 regulatory protein [Gracilimonas mengyeensis]
MKTKRKSKEEKQEEAVQLLPAPVSDIQVQKKNSHRFSLFVDNQFLIGISESTLTNLSLKKGVEITPSLFWEIVEAEEQWAAREYFFRLLSRRDHSRKELRDKAYKKGYKGNFIDTLLDEFEQKEYIDDRKFAVKYASDKFEFNNWGPYKIRTQLFKKGVSKPVAEQVLQQVFDEDDIRESMIELVQKKKRKYQRAEPEKRKKKLFDYFMRKGYDSEYIMKYMDELLGIIEE